MSEYNVTRANLIGPTVFRAKGIDTPMGVDGEGVLEIDATQHNACVVTGGTTIKGVRILNADGEMPDYEMDSSANLSQYPMLTIVSHDGTPLTVIHESLDVTEPSERIWVSDGADTAIDNKMVQVFFWPWLDSGTGRVRVFDWANVGAPPSSLRYSGTSAGAGTYTVAYASAFANVPNVTVSLIGGTVNQFAKITSRTVAGFTITCYTRNSSFLGLLGINILGDTATPTNGLTVDVLVTSND